MIRSIEKLKVRIDQNLNRAEKSEALSEEVVKVENKVTSLKQVCQSVTKKLSETTSSKGTDGAAVEKRIRKTSEFALGQTFQENGRSYLRHESTPKSGGSRESFSGSSDASGSGGALSQFLFESGTLLNDLAASQVTFEIGVEKLVLQTLTSIVDEHVPQLTKDKKTLTSLQFDYGAAKSRLLSHKAKEGNVPNSAGLNISSSSGSTYYVNTKSADNSAELKEEKLLSELSEIESKLNNSRDSVETQMHNFLSQEAKIGKTLLKYFELKREYHRQAAERIANEEEKFRQLLENAITPVYGEELSSHLKRSGTKIALPIRVCVCRLLQLDICEEGLFRVAAPTLKIRRLASVIDTGNCTDEQLLEISDSHVFAGALKLYLRELPTPLLFPYSKWISQCSASITPERRPEVIHSLLHSLPQENRENLNYLLRFLNLVSQNSDQNRMTASNLSIVLAPNLLWNSENAVNGADTSSLSHTNIINDIVESLISDVGWYFRGKASNDYTEIEDFFRGTGLEAPKQIGERLRRSGSAASKGGSPSSPAVGRVPVPKPRQSRPKGAPPPPIAPRPTERLSIQPIQLASDSTNL